MNDLFMVIDATSILDFSLFTKHRIPAAIPFFGKYRLIDSILTNATNSEITNVGIFTSGNYRSLQDHIGSGERYDLLRRRDGIFIMPPKVSNPTDEEFMSFSRLKEHTEFFKRSSQEYAIIAPSTSMINIDFNVLLDYHIKEEADITQVVNMEGERLFIFLLKKDLLMDYINNAPTISFRNIVDVFDHSKSIKKSTYIHKGFSAYVRSIKQYYNLFMMMLNDENLIEKMIYHKPRFRTKDPINEPTYYGKNASIKSSYVASGAKIYGSLNKCILSRRVIVEEGAIVENSILMNSCIIRKNAVIRNAILDKETEVKEGVELIGKINDPFITEKGQVILSASSPKVVFLTAECSPFVKVGGLSDMVGSLAKSLAQSGSEVTVCLPLYKNVKLKYFGEMEKSIEVPITIDSKEYRINTYKITEGKLSYVFFDLYMFFDLDKVYGYPNDAYRFAYYTLFTLEYLKRINYVPDIFHMHDWHPSLLPLFKKKYEMFKDSKTVLTIHNMNYTGLVSKDIITMFNLDYYVHGNMLQILEASINSSDIITTVSKTYAEELKYKYYSGELNEAILRRNGSLYGIVNGLPSKYDPKTDLEIKAQYGPSNVIRNKLINKKYLCEVCGFTYNPNMVIIGMVSRIDEAKGFDIVLNSLDEILRRKEVYFVLLGTGEKKYMDALKDYENRYKGRVRCFLDFYGTNPSYIYSGADIFLMPSRIEPCGTSQMIALKYGTIPVVRQTGGLNDTIDQFDSTTKRGNGFKFYNYDSGDLIYNINLAIDAFTYDKDGWKSLIKNAMNSNNSFEKCTREYLILYSLVRKGEK